MDTAVSTLLSAWLAYHAQSMQDLALASHLPAAARSPEGIHSFKHVYSPVGVRGAAHRLEVKHRLGHSICKQQRCILLTTSKQDESQSVMKVQSLAALA